MQSISITIKRLKYYGPSIIYSNNLTPEGIIDGNDAYLYGDDCAIIGLNQRKPIF